MKESKKAFEFISLAERPPKPRDVGLTEIRGPYYTVVGPRYLEDLLELASDYIDIYKFSGGSQRLLDRDAVRRQVRLCHDHDVLVSTGGIIERVLLQGQEFVEPFLDEVKALEFDIVEVSSGFIILPVQDKVELVKAVRKYGLKPKPEVSIVLGAGGATRAEELEKEPIASPSRLIEEAKLHLSAGAWKIMIESEGITESVKTWRTDVVFKIAEGLGLKNVMFEAADPYVFEWYIKNFGPDVNLFIDHSQIIQLEALRSGLWGKSSTWGRVVGYKPKRAP